MDCGLRGQAVYRASVLEKQRREPRGAKFGKTTWSASLRSVFQMAGRGRVLVRGSEPEHLCRIIGLVSRWRRKVRLREKGTANRVSYLD
jgi:hypothetical protein